MKKIIILIFLIAVGEVFGQSKDSLIQIKKEIELKKENLEKEINNLDRQLKIISEKIGLIEFSSNPHFTTTISYAGYLRDAPSSFGKTIININTNDTIELLEKVGDYWKAKCHNNVGFISNVYIKKTSELNEFTKFLESHENNNIVETNTRFKIKVNTIQKDNIKKHPSWYSVNANLNLSEIMEVECLSSINGMIKIKDNQGNSGYLNRFNVGGIAGSLIEINEEKLFKKDLQYMKENGKKLMINGAYVSDINSANGVNFKIECIFLDKSKGIKYLNISVLPYNRVGDVQKCDISKKSSFNGKISGPIMAEENVKYYEWENAWYNQTISCVKITKVSVIYMDGTSYTYLNELPKILNPEFSNSCD